MAINQKIFKLEKIQISNHYPCAPLDKLNTLWNYKWSWMVLQHRSMRLFVFKCISIEVPAFVQHQLTVCSGWLFEEEKGSIVLSKCFVPLQFIVFSYLWDQSFVVCKKGQMYMYYIKLVEKSWTHIFKTFYKLLSNFLWTYSLTFFQLHMNILGNSYDILINFFEIFQNVLNFFQIYSYSFQIYFWLIFNPLGISFKLYD
jgi:hypothetical protein